jgi:hypothetical protein
MALLLSLTAPIVAFVIMVAVVGWYVAVTSKNYKSVSANVKLGLVAAHFGSVLSALSTYWH